MNRQEIDSLMQQLRCANCHDYLICPPIVQRKDGTSVCGNCTPPFPQMSPDGTLVRQLALEQILRKFTFPCKYKAEGCQKRLFFGLVNHKEDDCVYRPLACPTGICPWSGTMFGIPKHFAEAHSTLMKNYFEFNLQIDEDSEGTTLAVFDKVPCLAKYVYNACKAELSFKVNCLTLDEVSYKMWIFNDLITDYGVSLERETCFPYTTEPRNGLTLDLEKYLPALEDPDSVFVGVEMLIEKADENVVAVPPGPASVPANGNLGGLGCACIGLMPKIFAINEAVAVAVPIMHP